MIFNENEMRAICKELGIEIVENKNTPLLQGKEISNEDIKNIFNNEDETYTYIYNERQDDCYIDEFKIFIDLYDDIELKDEFTNPLFTEDDVSEGFMLDKIQVLNNRSNVVDSYSYRANAV